MILGIDPGKQGAFVLMDMEGGIVWCVDMPEDDIEKDRIISSAIPSYIGNSTIVWIEKVHSMPNDGVASAFKFGENYGMLQGMLIANEFSINYVEPKVWQRAAGIRKTDKKRHCEICANTWPNIDFYGPRGGLKDGRADAALIASYGLGIVRKRGEL